MPAYPRFFGTIKAATVTPAIKSPRNQLRSYERSWPNMGTPVGPRPGVLLTRALVMRQSYPSPALPPESRRQRGSLPAHAECRNGPEVTPRCLEFLAVYEQSDVGARHEPVALRRPEEAGLPVESVGTFQLSPVVRATAWIPGRDLACSMMAWTMALPAPLRCTDGSTTSMRVFEFVAAGDVRVGLTGDRQRHGAEDQALPVRDRHRRGRRTLPDVLDLLHVRVVGALKVARRQVEASRVMRAMAS